MQPTIHSTMTSTHPILYSFRRCPYAMRARLAIASSGISVELREVALKDKPAEMLQASPKGTVPVLVLPASSEKEGQVIDESRDIMRWALRLNDPDNWLCADDPDRLWQGEALIQENDAVFKQHLDRYKYFERYPDHPQHYYREQCEVTLVKLERLLQQHAYLTGEQRRLADIAIFPFIRQFAHVDREWFYNAPYPALQSWLDQHLNSELFIRVMQKSSPWQSISQPQGD
ncbi:glutathione S-transferase [uncultured Amphritea sp.]|uniref:glutathione S-transferase n=1 Tax=uncultured Amphritea sp. TaxID=981605 RepID=UPI00343D1D08